MKKLALLTVFSLIILSMLGANAYAQSSKDYKFKTYIQGQLEVTSNLPDKINPVVIGTITDKNNNKKEAKGKVKHMVNRIYKEGNKDVYDIETEVTIQYISGPHNGSGDDEDPYSHMYQKQTMNWKYYKDTATYQQWYKIEKTTCWWERSRTDLVIGSNSVNIKIECYGTDMSGYSFSDVVFNNGLTPTWQSGNTRTYDIVTNGISTWPYASPVTPGMWSQCVSKCYNPYEFVGYLSTEIRL